jgi:hypothetical protein
MAAADAGAGNRRRSSTLSDLHVIAVSLSYNQSAPKQFRRFPEICEPGGMRGA